MVRTRSVRLVALMLMVAGAAAWVVLTASAPAVDAAAGALFDDPRYGDRVDPGDGELQIALFDARTAALLLVAAGVAASAARHVRSGAAAAAVALTALGVTLPVGALLTRAGTSSLTAAAVCGGVVLVTATVVLTVTRRWLLRSRSRHPDESAGRALLVSSGLLLVASMPALALQVPVQAWVRAEMPAAFMVGYTAVEVTLVLGGVALVAVTVPKPTAMVLAAVTVAVTVGGWVATAPTAVQHSLWAVLVVAAGSVGASTVLAVAGLRTADGGAVAGRRLLVAGAAAAVGYAALLVPSFMLAVSLGLGLLSLAGGELGADGLPLLLGATIAGLAAVAAYGWTRATMAGNPFVADDPRVTPA